MDATEYRFRSSLSHDRYAARGRLLLIVVPLSVFFSTVAFFLGRHTAQLLGWL